MYLKIVSEAMKEGIDNLNSFIDDEESVNRKISFETNSKPELVMSFPETTKAEIDTIINKETPEAKDLLFNKLQESPAAKPWRLIKASMFSVYEHNGKFNNIIKEVKKSLRNKFKKNNYLTGNYFFNLFE